MLAVLDYVVDTYATISHLNVFGFLGIILLLLRYHFYLGFIAFHTGNPHYIASVITPIYISLLFVDLFVRFSIVFNPLATHD